MELSVGLLSIALVDLVLGYILYQNTWHPLASVPGPFLARLTRLWLVKHSWDGDMHTTMIELHKKYGNLVRTGPNEVSVCELAAVKQIYGAGTRFRKSNWYSVFQGHRKFDIFAERDEQIHAAQRRLVSRAYSVEALKDLESEVDSAIGVFLNCMRHQQDRIVDMAKWVQLFAFDVIGDVTFSKRFGFMVAGSDDGSIKQINAALKCAAWIGQVSWLYWLHDALMPYIGNHLAITVRHGSIRNFAVKEIAARQDRAVERKDILSKLRATQKEKPLELDDVAVTSMATSNIFAGSDTTAISTRAIIYYLLKNPSCKQRLVGELLTLRDQGKLSDPVTMAEAEKISYLQAVMYEALRLHPAVGMNIPRVAPPGGANIAGVHVPGGTIVGVNPWVLHRNRDVFGEDVEAFRPERWMGEKQGDMHRFFFAFGSGARTCMGRNLSWIEMWAHQRN
ncbi:cytochrome P450 [Piedraia hortae CBS 480.64]|uniref:Cytochrome P450 n=1 Tax=Piedraia hortae CBS 480.64 TaxID=1314780 RepID=A0A6A7C457_9PEZI|nr:cytochrome P450 [Piedraia hortae CBS 480.64]